MKILWLLKWHSPMRTYHKSISTSIDRLWPPSTAKLDVHLLISFAGACQSVTQTAHKTAQISSNCSLIVHVIKTCAFPRMKNHWKTSYSKRGQQKLCLYDVPMTCSGRSKKYGRSICGSSQPDFSENTRFFDVFWPEPIEAIWSACSSAIGIHCWFASGAVAGASQTSCWNDNI